MENEQKLFLIEFLVDRVSIPVVKAMHEEFLPTSTCVSFQILNLPAVKIYQESSSEACGCAESDTMVFRKGKSCLFALPALVLAKPLSSFPITMSVHKELPPGVLPDVMLIGSKQIELKEIMNMVLQDDAFKVANPCKTLKDIFDITTATGQCVGEVKVFIRASCLGKKIVTQFQIPHNRKPYLFKAANDVSVFQCKKIPSNYEESSNCNCATKKADGSGEATSRTYQQLPRQKQCPPKSNLLKSTGNSSRPCCQPSSSRQGGQDGCVCNVTQVEQRQKSCGVASPRRQMEIANCPPCCAKGQTPLADAFSKGPAVRKCGCTIKEQRNCNCGRN